MKSYIMYLICMGDYVYAKDEIEKERRKKLEAEEEKERLRSAKVPQ